MASSCQASLLPRCFKGHHHLFKTGCWSRGIIEHCNSEESRSVLNGLRKLAECNVVKCVATMTMYRRGAAEASLELDVSSVGSPCRALKPRPGVALENRMVHEWCVIWKVWGGAKKFGQVQANPASVSAVEQRCISRIMPKLYYAICPGIGPC